MKAAHTPGPWHTGNAPSGGHSLFIYDSRGYVVAKPSYHGGSTNAEVAANARLISAAPELLAALENTLAQLLKMWQHDHSNPLYAVLQEVRAGIAKVEGNRRAE